MLILPKGCPKDLVQELEACQKQLRILIANYQVTHITIIIIRIINYVVNPSYHPIYVFRFLQVLKQRSKVNPNVSHQQSLNIFHFIHVHLFFQDQTVPAQIEQVEKFLLQYNERQVCKSL